MSSSKPLRLGIAGLGTVGIGVIDILRTEQARLFELTGRAVEIVAVSAKDKTKKRNIDLKSITWIEQAEDLATHPNIDAIVEVIGGAEGVARTLVERALKNGKSVVTANKALMAYHGQSLAVLAEKKNASLRFEAAVAGGIPIIKTLREGLAGNHIEVIYGILNGTCNYILTEMREKNMSFDAALLDAQQKGYAESDPAFDIDGFDAAHKLALLTALAYGCAPDLAHLPVRGIRSITDLDITYAEENDFRIKLLGISRLQAGAIEQGVEPCLVPKNYPIAYVEGVFNAVVVEGHAVGPIMIQGRGAGAGPTASAVVADILDLASGRYSDVFGRPVQMLQSPQYVGAHNIMARYYLHLRVVDKPGVMADIASVLRDQKISIESLKQPAKSATPEGVSVLLTTHTTSQASIVSAISALDKLADIRGPTSSMRII